MNLRRTALFCLASAAMIAAAEPGAADVIPQGHQAERYAVVWQKNPFLRATKVTDQPKVVWSRDWVLGGIARYDGGFRVTLRNTRTGESRRLMSNDPPDAEMRVTQIHFSRLSSESFAEVQKGGETAILRFARANP
jgi:hypothetical protein